MSSQRWPKRRSLGGALWIASFILGLALITGALGGAGVQAAPGVHTRPVAVTNRSYRTSLPGVHRRLLQQRIGGTPMSSQ